jgi:hypothetical protein
MNNQTHSAQVQRAIARINICTTTDDLERVWANLQPLYLELRETPGEEAVMLLRQLCGAKVEVQLDIGP